MGIQSDARALERTRPGEPNELWEVAATWWCAQSTYLGTWSTAESKGQSAAPHELGQREAPLLGKILACFLWLATRVPGLVNRHTTVQHEKDLH